MRTYDYACECGVRFEATVTDAESTPPCPACGGPTRRLPAAGAALLGRARLPADASSAPKSWDGTYQGDTEYIARWRHTLDERAKLEERYPELAERESPVVAHEGRYSSAPLTYDEVARAAQHPDPHTHTDDRPDSERS